MTASTMTSITGNVTISPPINPLDHKSCNDAIIPDYFSPAFTGFVVGFLIIVAIISVFGNLLVILVIFTNRSMRDLNRCTNIFLCNLAFADLITGLQYAIFSVTTVIHECWEFPRWLCTFNSCLTTVFYCVSIHTLMYISIYKYLSIRRIYYNNFLPLSNKVCYVMILASWIWGAVLAVLTTVVLSKSVYKPKTIQCGPQYPKFEERTFVLHNLNQLFGIVLPLGIMTFAYVNIFIYTHKNAIKRRRMSCGQSSISSSTIDSGEKGRIVTFVIVLACFLLCWAPYAVYTNIATYTKDKATLPFYINPLAYCFGFLNSACNPIIYAFRFRDFRQGYLDILRRTPFVVTIVDGGRRVVRPVSRDISSQIVEDLPSNRNGARTRNGEARDVQKESCIPLTTIKAEGEHATEMER